MYGRVPPDVFFGMVCYALKKMSYGMTPAKSIGTAEGTLGLNV